MNADDDHHDEVDSDEEDSEEDEEELLAQFGDQELIDEELEWALALKSKVREDANLEERPDFDYATVAIYCMDDLEDAKHRMLCLQHFRDQYKIKDSVEEGMDLITRCLVDQQPWFFLDVHVDAQHSVLAQDFSRLNPKALQSDDDWRVFLGSKYYLLQVLQPTLAAIRRGILCIAEVEGMGWDNFDPRVMQRHHSDLLEYYPLTIREARFLHSSVMGNIFLSLLKKVRRNLPNSKIEEGCQWDELDNGRLEEIFKSPTPEEAQRRLLDKCRSLLEQRYRNCHTYRLPTPAWAS